MRQFGAEIQNHKREDPRMESSAERAVFEPAHRICVLCAGMGRAKHYTFHYANTDIVETVVEHGSLYD